jgi:glycosyltransferase involved in cell wall biosynthesis
MKVGMIGCWFKYDMYSHHLNAVRRALGSNGNFEMALVTSNCNCFSSTQTYAIAEDELLNKDCLVIKLPHAPVEPRKTHGLFKYYVVKYLRVNYFLEITRGMLFFLKIRDCGVVHFDQVTRSFGFLSLAVLLSLSKLFGKRVVVTVHELDPLQEQRRALNKLYNKADRIIVFSEDLKDDLIKLDVEKEKIKIIPYVSPISPLSDFKREGFIFFGGHKLLQGKGFDILLGALKILQSQGKDVKITTYVGHGCIGFEEGRNKVHEMGLEKFFVWREFLYDATLEEAYQSSWACLIPYTGGSGRHPATCAMANACPVICTNKASIPEYLGDLGHYLGNDSPEELAEAMVKVMNDPGWIDAQGKKLRQRAEERYTAEAAAEELAQIYRDG